MESIIRRIYYKGRNAQRSLISRLGKQRMRKELVGVHTLGPAIFTWYAELYGAEVEPYATGQATVQTLPDDVLHEIFKYHRLASLTSGPWKWHRLAQVCRRWRFIVYTHPRLLDLPIILTNTNPIWETPDFFPADTPVILWYRYSLSDEDIDNIFDTLKNPARICEMDVDMTRSLLEKCGSLLEESFPALGYLRLESRGTTSGRALVIPDNFLGNSAPRLRVVRLQNTVCPTLPRLLSTSQNLVSLQLEHIPGERIFTAQELAVGLSSTPQLESLKIGIHGDVSSGFIWITPRILAVLPSLLEFQYVGQRSYLNDLAYMIDTPIVGKIGVTFVNSRWGCDISGVCRLFAAGEELRSSRLRTTRIEFLSESVIFAHHFTCSTISSPGSFQVRFVDRGWSLDYVILVSQICRQFQSLGIMHKVIWVEIGGSPSPSRRVMDAKSWLYLLRTLSGVERLYVIGTVVSNVMFTLSEVPVDGTGEILPALRDLHLPDKHDEPRWSANANIGVDGDIKRFVAARKLCGLPISVHYEGHNAMTAA